LKVLDDEVLDSVGVRAVDGANTKTRRRDTPRRAKTARPAKPTGRPAAQSRGKGASGGALRVLKLVDDRPGITVSELAQHVATSKSSPYRLMSRLEDEDKVRKRVAAGIALAGRPGGPWPAR
jgi:hypothetical protein